MIEKKYLMQASLQAIAFILENTFAGKDKHNRPFVSYSKKTFGMPLGAYYSRVGKGHQKRLQDDTKIYRNKNTGGLWILIKGGYQNFKSKWNPEKASTVNLSFTGQMLKELHVMEVGNSYSYIGFKSKEMSERASFHALQGAGRSKVIRDFLGIHKKQEETLANYLSEKFKTSVETKIKETIRGL